MFIHSATEHAGLNRTTLGSISLFIRNFLSGTGSYHQNAWWAGTDDIKMFKCHLYLFKNIIKGQHSNAFREGLKGFFFKSNFFFYKSIRSGLRNPSKKEGRLNTGDLV